MSASNPAPERQNPRPEAEARKTSGPRDTGALSAEFLEKVLAETELAVSGADALRPQERHALLQVAEKYAGQPLTFTPVAVELVEAMLESQFSSTEGGPPRWHRVAENIARALMDDPVAKEKLRSLWDHLSDLST